MLGAREAAEKAQQAQHRVCRWRGTTRPTQRHAASQFLLRTLEMSMPPWRLSFTCAKKYHKCRPYRHDRPRYGPQNPPEENDLRIFGRLRLCKHIQTLTANGYTEKPSYIPVSVSTAINLLIVTIVPGYPSIVGRMKWPAFAVALRGKTRRETVSNGSRRAARRTQ